MTAPALILDFGGVISRTLFETHAITEKVLGLPAGCLTWRGPFEPEGDSLWRAMQSGELSERDYWIQRTLEVGELVGENWTEMSQFVIAARGADIDAIIRPEALATITEARALGAKVAVLSNELDLFYGAGFGQTLSFMEEDDIIIDATYTKILKPDPRAYNHCAEALQLACESCVFVDDQFKNIRGAQQVGMQTVHFDVQRVEQSFQQALDLLQHT
ncbi:MAG: HAD-IA family hydrolase [Halieaceae bacterium]|nr:HAD-IA family hydrolase [Halieaceae bacterium]